MAEIRRKIGKGEFLLRPEIPSDANWSFNGWKNLPIRKLKRSDIDFMLQTSFLSSKGQREDG